MLVKGISTLVHRDAVLDHSQVGSCMALLTNERSEKVKVRCVFKGKQQNTELVSYLRSTTSTDDALMVCLSITMAERWNYVCLIVTYAFSCASLRKEFQLFLMISYGHPQFHSRGSDNLK